MYLKGRRANITSVTGIYRSLLLPAKLNRLSHLELAVPTVRQCMALKAYRTVNECG